MCWEEIYKEGQGITTKEAVFILLGWSRKRTLRTRTMAAETEG